MKSKVKQRLVRLDSGLHRRAILYSVGLALLAMLTGCQSWMQEEGDSERSVTSPQSNSAQRTSRPEVRMQLFELSGAALVEDGILIADDELVGTVYFSPSAALDNLHLLPVKVERDREESAPFSKKSKLFPVQDFEGLTSSGDTVFLIGSHEPHRSEARRSDREFVIKAKWDDGDLRFKKIYKDLLPDMEDVFKEIDVDLDVKTTKVEPKVNIEGVAVNEDVLFVGFREPQSDNKAILVSVNQKQLFDGEPEYSISTIALGGAGIRGLHWDEDGNRLLLLSGGADDKGDKDAAIIPGVWALELGGSEPALLHAFTPEELGGPPGEKRAKPEAIVGLPDGRVAILMDGESVSVSNVLYLDL